MNAIRQYALSVICGALMVSILLDLAAKSGFQKQLRLVCGIFFAAVLLRPLIHLDFPVFSSWHQSFSAQAEEAAAQGENIRIRSIAGIIRQETEAYILKEAEAMGARVEVEIELTMDDPPAPAAATLRGVFDGSQEARLSTLLEEKIGIPKERQTWIRQPNPSSEASSQNTSTFF